MTLGKTCWVVKNCRDISKMHGLISSICLLLQFVSAIDLFYLLQLDDQGQKVHVISIGYMCNEVVVYVILFICIAFCKWISG